jgi:hypothetical protein
MRFATIALLATAVSADAAEDAKMLDSAPTTIDFTSDNADEKASLTFKTTMEGDVKSVSGTTTIMSKVRDLNNFRFEIGLKATEAETNCLAKDVVFSGNVDNTEKYTTESRTGKADQLNCADGNQLLNLLTKGNMNDGSFKQVDKDYLKSSAERTQKRTGEVPAIAVTTWSRPVVASAGGDWIALPLEDSFLATLAWSAGDQRKYSRTQAAPAIVWSNAKILKLVKPKSASALQMGAAALVLATASLL